MAPQVPAPLSEFYGHVENCTTGQLSGWVWDPQNPENRETVNVFLDEVLVLTFVADQLRKDLLAANFGDGQYGFHIAPFELGSARSITVVAENTGVQIPISDPFFQRGETIAEDSLESNANVNLQVAEPSAASPVSEPDVLIAPQSAPASLSASTAVLDDTSFDLLLTPQFWLVGAIDNEGPHSLPPQILLLVDGEEFARTLADKPVPPTMHMTEKLRSGFLFQLPDPPNDTLTRKIRVVCGAAARELIVDYRQRYRGNFERYEFADKKLRVAGWVHDEALEFTPVAVDVIYEGATLATIVANKTRPDLKEAGVGMGNHCFDAIVASDVGITDPSKLEIRVTNSAITLARHKLQVFDIANSILTRTADPKHNSSTHDVEAFSISQGGLTRAHGYVDVMSKSEIRGWAFDPDEPNAHVVLDFLIDNQLVATTRTDRFRADLAQKFGSAGYHGFSFEVLPQYGSVVWRHFTVAVRRGAVLGNGAQNIQMLPVRVALEDLALPTKSARDFDQAMGSSIFFSLIVLNLNGSKILREFFRTIDFYESNRNFEILIIDHGSADDSADVCKEYLHLNVKFIPRGRNFSFSESNNFGAKQAKGEIVICLNNDVFWCQAVLDTIGVAFDDETIGCVGIQLLDTPANNKELIPPTVQTVGLHFNFHLRDRAIHPIETRFDSSIADAYFNNSDVPGVTGAFLAMRAKDFAQIGGFDAGYNYGYEDVDLCLKVLFDLNLRIVCQNSARAFHHRGYSRKKSEKWAGSNMSRNRTVLEQNFAYRMRRDLMANFFERAPFWQGKRLVIAFAVTEATNNTAAGDFFTAAEFGEALQRIEGVQVVFLEEKKNWYDVQDVDILIVMRHEYQLDKLINKKTSLVTIAWARNWFEKWADSSDVKDYNFLAASGDDAVEFLHRKLRREVFKLNIATNSARFSPDQNAPKIYDVIFTGNFWGHPREVAYMFKPEVFTGSFRAFGSGWDRVTNWAPYADGLKAYGELAGIYKQTRIVLDDANSVTKEWGSVNSRVYDAIASGCLVLTNGVKGSASEFGGHLPTYSSAHELHDLLNRYMRDPVLFQKVQSELRTMVLSDHTYDNRVSELLANVGSGLRRQRRFAIKIGAPSKAVAFEWGDYHFAEALKNAFVELGHVVRIDCLDTWDDPIGYNDDCVIVLRGLSVYRPKPYQCNVLWIISHPDLIAVAECESYDLVFTASEKHKEHLRSQHIDAMTLLQCTDHRRFNLGEDDDAPVPSKPIFVGNTRNVYRNIVRHAIEADLDFDVVGAGWRDFIPASYVSADYLENKSLPALYRSSEFVLNDHWDSMKNWGFISNRVFDVVASGTPCLSDEVEGIDELFGRAVVTYDGKKDFRSAANTASQLREEPAMLQKASEKVRNEHSFLRRAEQILEQFSKWEK